MNDAKFRSRLNIYMILTLCMFGASCLFLMNSVLTMYQADIESRFLPVYTDRTHTEWRQEEDGSWSAIVFLNKRRSGCVYVRDQIETVVGVTPSGTVHEANIVYIGDRSPGSNRPGGWQQLDLRVMFDNPALVEGSIIRGSTLHQCHANQATVTSWGPVVIGEEQSLPSYVQAWYENGREGDPDDYR